MARIKLEEVGIFPKVCIDGHNYTPFIRQDEERNPGYYKRDSKEKADTSKVYAMLFCKACGQTREICIVNRAR